MDIIERCKGCWAFVDGRFLGRIVSPQVSMLTSDKEKVTQLANTICEKELILTLCPVFEYRKVMTRDSMEVVVAPVDFCFDVDEAEMMIKASTVVLFDKMAKADRNRYENLVRAGDEQALAIRAQASGIATASSRDMDQLKRGSLIHK